MSRTEEGRTNLLILKFGKILRKKVAWKLTAMRAQEREMKDMNQRAGMINEIRAVTVVERALDEALSEFRKDAENAGAIWPLEHRKTRRQPKKETPHKYDP